VQQAPVESSTNSSPDTLNATSGPVETSAPERTRVGSGPALDGDITTVIIHVARKSDGTPEMFMNDLDLLGFAGQYDYFYSPKDRKGAKGYVFVNMLETVYVQRLCDCLEMLHDPQMECLQLVWLDKNCTVQAARIQGRDENMRHFWSICKGLWPVHDNVPYIRSEGKMLQKLPWDYLDEQPPDALNVTPQTLCLRGIPNRIGPVEMMEILDKNGFEGSYSYFFMPCDVRSFNHRGYAFVHLDSAELARLFIDNMNCYAFEEPSGKLLRVCMAKQQGVITSLQSSKSISFSGSLLYYPWVRIEGEMKCLSTEKALRACLNYLTSKENGTSMITEGHWAEEHG
jgi:hypothetical protein